MNDWKGGINVVSTVLLNEIPIEVMHFAETTVPDKVAQKELRKVAFDFHVTSKEYHDITTLLYTNDFAVSIPEKNMEFRAEILNYSTSVTNLYKANEVGTFYLELIEKV